MENLIITPLDDLHGKKIVGDGTNSPERELKYYKVQLAVCAACMVHIKPGVFFPINKTAAAVTHPSVKFRAEKKTDYGLVYDAVLIHDLPPYAKKKEPISRKINKK